MGKIIALCGSPASGKTTAGLKIAQEVYFTKRASVIFVSPDWNKPTLTYFFPLKKESDLFSLGRVLDKTSITPEDLLKGMVYSSNMNNFGFLGYKSGENRFSYPKPTTDKVLSLLSAASELADYVFVDCSSYFDDPISEIAISNANNYINFIVPDILSMVYYSSYEKRYSTIEHNTIKIINRTFDDVFLPESEVKEHFKPVTISLPYSMMLKQQSLSGTLAERINDTKFKKECSKLAGLLP